MAQTPTTAELCLPVQLSRGFLAFVHTVVNFFLHSVQVDLKTVPLLPTQKDISKLLNYRVAQNRSCVRNLISGIVKISSLNNKRWKSHNACDSSTGTTIVQCTNRPFCPLWFGLTKVNMCKANTWFLTSDEQAGISSCSFSLVLSCFYA